MLLEGVHPKIAQERLGHSTITTTMDLYSAMSPIQCRAMLRLGSTRRGGGGDQIRDHIGVGGPNNRVLSISYWKS